MPNKKTHLITAVMLGLIAGMILYDSWVYALIFTLLSGVSTSLPDTIEKPTDSMHRGFFHSITFFIILVVFLAMTIWSPLSGIIFGYVTHLLLDYARTTHKPII